MYVQIKMRREVRFLHLAVAVSPFFVFFLYNQFICECVAKLMQEQFIWTYFLYDNRKALVLDWFDL